MFLVCRVITTRLCCNRFCIHGVVVIRESMFCVLMGRRTRRGGRVLGSTLAMAVCWLFWLIKRLKAIFCRRKMCGCCLLELIGRLWVREVQTEGSTMIRDDLARRFLSLILFYHPWMFQTTYKRKILRIILRKELNSMKCRLKSRNQDLHLWSIDYR